MQWLDCCCCPHRQCGVVFASSFPSSREIENLLIYAFVKFRALKRPPSWFSNVCEYSMYGP